MMTIPGEEEWWLEEIPHGFILMHSAHGRDCAARIDWEPKFAPGLREAVAENIVELRELVNQVDIWIKN